VRRIIAAMRRSRIALIVAMVLAAVLSYNIVAPPSGPRSIRLFDGVRVANLELRMWQAYYAKDRVRSFTLLVATLHEEYHYSWAVAVSEGFHLARAAATFSDLRSNYDVVLPDLEAAYSRARAWLRADFDPHAVARAELAWWVARRTPGRNSADQVAELMADEYAMLYDAPRELVGPAAALRAEASALRDAEATRPDWEAIGSLLQQSYRELLGALSATSA